MSQSSEQFLEQREREDSGVQFLRETTALQRRAYVMNIVEQVENGNLDPLAVHVQLKCTQDLIELMTGKEPLAEAYKALLLSAAEKHGKSFELHNCQFQIKEAGVKYDYSQCNDKEIRDLHLLQKTVKTDVDSREKFLKSLSLAGMEVLDKETGELVRVYPPAKTSTTVVSTSVK